VIVRCRARELTEEQARQLGSYYNPKIHQFHMAIGREFVVFALSVLGGQPWVDVLPDPAFGYIEPGFLVARPLFLFDIVEGHMSQYWELRREEKGDLLFWPSSLYREYYMDDLTNFVPEIVEDFRRVRGLIEAEAASHSQGS
jgi:hypothetical protein